MVRSLSFLFFFLFLLTAKQVVAQKPVTAEDSLQSGATRKQSTFVGGYGEVSYKRDFNEQSAFVNLDRAVLFFGHRFSDKISVFTEFELEDAKLAGGDPGGEFSVEQAYLKFNLSRNLYLTGGLFIPRIGLVNEDHLPGNFRGVERPMVERLVIPATWREIGIGLYGRLNRIPLQFSLAVCNGLNSASFEHGTGIRNGRFEGKDATANNLAVTGSLRYSAGSVVLQASGYAGGSVGLSPKQADSLKLTSGLFGTPVILGEFNARYEYKGFACKALGAIITIPDASDLNRAYASNTPEMIFGAYLEAGYNLLETCSKRSDHQCWLFVRYEKLDLNSRIPTNGIMDETLKRDYIIAGINYFPLNNVVIKADVKVLRTGKENEELVINPVPGEPEYLQHNTFLNIGIGYSF